MPALLSCVARKAFPGLTNPVLAMAQGGVKIQDKVFVVNEVYGTFASHDYTPRGVVRRNNIGTAIHGNLQFIITLQLELTAGIISHPCFEQSYVDIIRQLEQQRALALEPLFIGKRRTGGGKQRALLVRSLCPFLVPSHRAVGKGKTGLFARDMEKETVGSFGEVVAQSNALVIGTHDDVHCIKLALIVAFGNNALSVAPFLVVQYQLVVVVAYTCILAVRGRPRGVNACSAVYAFQHEVATPVFMNTTRHGKSRFKKAVVNIHAKPALPDNRLPLITYGISHALYSEHIAAVGRGKLLSSCYQRYEYEKE